MGLVYAKEPLHIDEVESAANIVKRFCTGKDFESLTVKRIDSSYKI